MEFHQIRYFLAVSEQLSFTRAAETCAVSQPALSKAIRKLEESLGSELFKRNTSDVELTEFGQLMKIHFERIEENKRIAEHTAHAALKAEDKKLQIGVMCTINAHRFVPFLEVFRRQNPNVEFTIHDVTEPVISGMLLSGELDCVFCIRGSTLDPRFAGLKLYEENMVVAFANNHRFSDREHVSIFDLAKENYLDRLHCEFRAKFTDFTRSAGVTLNVLASSEREDWIFEFINKGFGVSVVPESSVQSENVSHKIISELESTRIVELVMTTQAASSNPTLTSFYQALQEFDW